MKTRMLVAAAAGAAAAIAAGATGIGWASTHSGPAASARASTASGDVYFDAFKDVDTLTGSPSSPTVVTSTSVLAAGNYLITAKVIAAGRERSFARAVCQLRYPGWSGSIATTDQSAATVGTRNGAAEDQTLSLEWAASFTTAGRVSLVCWPENQAGAAPSLTDGSLAVLPVASVAP
jgi:hypothetical protein